jgi:hypothetical protein
MAHEHAGIAVQMLKDTLPDPWQIQGSVSPIPAVGLTGLQIEQIVLNLGYLCADASPAAGILKIVLSRPGSDPLLSVGNQYAGVLVVSTLHDPAVPASPMTPQSSVSPEPSRESGVILSVLRSMIEEAQGYLDISKSPDGSPLYRVALPYGNLPQNIEGSEQALRELAPYIARWSVLLALAPGHHSALIEKRLRELNVSVESADSVMATLARIERTPPLDGVIVDRNLLKSESESLLRAMAKLCPGAGIVALSENPQTEPPTLAADVVFTSAQADVNATILSLVEARTLATRRRQPKA